MNYSIGIQLGDEEGEKLNIWIFVKKEVLNVWIFVKNKVLNVWIFEKMALQGIVEYERSFRLLGWEMEVDLGGMNDKNVYIRIDIGSDFYPNVSFICQTPYGFE